MQRFVLAAGVCVGLLGFTFFAVAGEGDRAAKQSELSQAIDAAGNATDKVKAFAKEKLLPLCTNQVFVQEVKAQNAKQVSLQEIQTIDKTWAAAEDELPIQKEKLNNECAQETKRVAQDLKLVTEVFVMDNQGANVGQNALTSDYWQGDEPKWQKSFNGGKGGVDVSDRKFDKSTNCEDQKVSLPILDDSGEVIGAVCVGLKADQL
jgi:hypothetical protein